MSCSGAGEAQLDTQPYEATPGGEAAAGGTCGRFATMRLRNDCAAPRAARAAWGLQPAAAGAFWQITLRNGRVLPSWSGSSIGSMSTRPCGPNSRRIDASS